MFLGFLLYFVYGIIINKCMHVTSKITLCKASLSITSSHRNYNTNTAKHCELAWLITYYPSPVCPSMSNAHIVCCPSVSVSLSSWTLLLFTVLSSRLFGMHTLRTFCNCRTSGPSTCQQKTHLSLHVNFTLVTVLPVLSFSDHGISTPNISQIMRDTKDVK